jgi:alpha-L-fucosidase
MNKRLAISTLLLGLLATPAFAQHAEHPYVRETDQLVVRKLEQWQDWKFGFMMHWGPYSQWGVVESWSLCSEDVGWCGPPQNNPNTRQYTNDYKGYVKAYEQLPNTFNPVKFDPAAWARVAEDAGMKYVVFTTKHHDGFSMFDTKQTDYRITAPNVPFHDDPRANITKEVFDAFRARDFGIGAYFSKPDWNSDNYWWPRFATPNRHNNYDVRKHPKRWQGFVDFTHKQIDELTSDYGKVDILWLDGGWVRPTDTMDYANVPGPDATPGVPWAQDIDMPGLVKMARRNQPGLIVVDRAVGGPYENYRTPEQKIPDAPLPYPWETCMTLGGSWSYVPNDKYKPAREVVHMLVDVVAKGGNYLLNVGPKPDGQLPEEAVARLQEIGAWMQVNGSAIYDSRAVPPYSAGKFRYTRMDNGDVYAIYLADAREKRLPAKLEIPGPAPRAGAMLTVLGSDIALPFKRVGDRTVVEVPNALRKATADAYAWAIRLPGAQPVAAR